MGYTTEFRGRFELDKKLDNETMEFLQKLANTRRMKRNVGSEYGIEGEFYVDGGGYMGQEHEPNVIDFNNPPMTQPSLWLQWIPTEDGMGIEWDGAEKFYCSFRWIKYLIENVLQPRGYILNGVVDAEGERFGDVYSIVVVDNIATLRELEELIK